jgi:4-methylaminobutanoate oxidase (formaldehyde-forming)
MSNEAFPYLTAQEIDIAYALVRALRVTYVGELGWELYVPSEFTLHVFDALIEAGKDLGLRHAGFQALNTLRIEKGYRDYGHDIDNTDTPLEVGLGFFVDFDKPGGFIGKEALLKQKEEGVKSLLVHFLLEDPEPLLYGSEPIYRDGIFVGDLGGGGYFIKSGSYEIEVSGKRYKAKASLRPFYDPRGKKVRS